MYVSTIQQLRQRQGAQAADTVEVLGYHRPHDQGGGRFVFDAGSTAPDDGGSVITPVDATGRPQTAAGRWHRLTGEPIKVEWFGTFGDGTQDDHPAIQKAIDYALQHKVQTVTLGNGVFKICRTLHLGYGQDFSTVRLVGSGPKTRNVNFSGTTLLAVFDNAPAIAVQGGRYSKVAALTLMGQNFDYIQNTFFPTTLEHSINALFEKAPVLDEPSTWLHPSLRPKAASRFAPYAGIAIDPYSGQQPNESYPDIAYPAWTGVEAQYNKAFSSGVIIEDVQIHGFVVGIVQQPCNASGNADFIKIHRCFFEAGLYGISIGGDQSRNVSIRDCEYAYLHSFLVNGKHGRLIGRLDGPVDNISGGASYQFCDIGSLAYSGPLVFRHIYFESQIRFGRLLAGGLASPVVFEACSVGTMRFGPEKPPEGEDADFMDYNPAQFIDSAGSILSLHFIGCTLSFRKFLNLINTSPTNEDTCQITFENCSFHNQAGATLGPANENEQRAQNHFLGGVFCAQPPKLVGSVISFYQEGSSSQPYHFGQTVRKGLHARKVVHQGAERIAYKQRTFPHSEVAIRARKPIEPLPKNIPTNIAALSYRDTELRLQNVQPDVYSYTIMSGDVLYDQRSETVFVVEQVESEMDGEQQKTIVMARQVTNLRTTRKAGEQSLNQTSNVASLELDAGYLVLYPCSAMATQVEFRGTTTKGEQVIRDVRRADGVSVGLEASFKTGDLLFYSNELWMNSPFPQVTWITAVDEAAGTIMVNQAANESRSDYVIGISVLW